MWYWLLVWTCLVTAERNLQCDVLVLLVADGQWKEIWVGQQQLTENKVPFHKEWNDPDEWSVKGGHIALKSMAKFPFLMYQVANRDETRRGFMATLSVGGGLLTTDASWKCTRKEEPGWWEANFDDSHW